MGDATRIRRQFSKAAATYAANDAVQHKAATRLLQYMPTAHGVWLDIGAGVGRIASSTNYRPLVQLDSAYGMCHYAHAHAPVIQAEALQLPLAAGSIGQISSNLCLQWSQHIPDMLAEWLRVLRVGGVLGYTTLVQGSMQQCYDALQHVGCISGAVQQELAYPPAGLHVPSGCDVLHHSQYVQPTYQPDIWRMLRHFQQLGVQRVVLEHPLTPLRVRRMQECWPSTTQGLRLDYHIELVVLRKR